MLGKYRVKLAGLILILSMLPAGATSIDNGKVDGAHGTLHVRGALTESACRLDMASSRQTVDLGEISTRWLLHMGDRGTPVKIAIRLRDCLPSGAHHRDGRTGNVLWDPEQPAATFEFLAPADDDNPELIAVRGGVSGLALRLTDSAHRDVRLGSRGAPLLLTPGQNELIYYVVPERTRSPLLAGAFQAQVNFRLNYE